MCSRPTSLDFTHAQSLLLAPLAPGRSLLELASAWDALAPRLPSRSPEDTRIILEALKLAVSRAPPPAVADNDSATPPVAALAASAALGTAARLADLAAYDGLPLDAAAMCAGILADGAAAGRVSMADAAARVGPDAATLLGDVLRVRSLPVGADVYDGATSAWLRDAALERVDRRAAMVEVAARAAGLAEVTRESGGGSTTRPTIPSTAALTSVAALEALQVYAPLGHALGMGRVAAEMEDAAFRILFPRAYTETDAWLASVVGPAASTLAGARDTLVDALASDETLADLAGGCEVRVRVKSLFSLMKKLLRLDDLDAGGRDRGALHDVLGMRVIVHPRDVDDEEVEGKEGDSGDAAASAAASAAAADADAITACYAVRDAALRLWPRLPDRDKDYIAAPKANGYASLHVTLVVGGEGDAGGGDARRDADVSRRGTTVVELQIRTRAMHDAAEHGHAAHTAYKGGMTPQQTSALAAWSAHARALRGSDRPDSDASSSSTTSLPLDRTESAAALFHALDIDGDGNVSADELASALGDLGVDGGAAVAAAAALVAAAGSGGEALTLAEFQSLMAKVRVWVRLWVRAQLSRRVRKGRHTPPPVFNHPAAIVPR